MEYEQREGGQIGMVVCMIFNATVRRRFDILLFGNPLAFLRREIDAVARHAVEINRLVE